MRPNSRLFVREFLLLSIVASFLCSLSLPARAETLSQGAEVGKRLYNEGKLDETIEKMTKQVSLHPDDMVARYYLALSLYRKNRRQEAYPHLKAISVKEPHSAMGSYCSKLIGIILTESKTVKKEDGFVGLKFLNTGVVQGVFEGSPAERAGVRVNDRIVAVDGLPVEGFSQDAIAKLIIGPLGSSVSLKLMRAGKPLEVTVTRGKIYREAERIWIKDH